MTGVKVIVEEVDGGQREEHIYSKEDFLEFSGAFHDWISSRRREGSRRFKKSAADIPNQWRGFEIAAATLVARRMPFGYVEIARELFGRPVSQREIHVIRTYMSKLLADSKTSWLRRERPGVFVGDPNLIPTELKVAIA